MSDQNPRKKPGKLDLYLRLRLTAPFAVGLSILVLVGLTIYSFYRELFHLLPLGLAWVFVIIKLADEISHYPVRALIVADGFISANYVSVGGQNGVEFTLDNGTPEEINLSGQKITHPIGTQTVVLSIYEAKVLAGWFKQRGQPMNIAPLADDDGAALS